MTARKVGSAVGRSDKFQFLKVAEIVAPLHSVRPLNDDPLLIEYMDSIFHEGFTKPIMVCRIRTKSGTKYRIIDGHIRWEAAKRLMKEGRFKGGPHGGKSKFDGLIRAQVLKSEVSEELLRATQIVERRRRRAWESAQHVAVVNKQLKKTYKRNPGVRTLGIEMGINRNDAAVYLRIAKYITPRLLIKAGFCNDVHELDISQVRSLSCDALERAARAGYTDNERILTLQEGKPKTSPVTSKSAPGMQQRLGPQDVDSPQEWRDYYRDENTGLIVHHSRHPDQAEPDLARKSVAQTGPAMETWIFSVLYPNAIIKQIDTGDGVAMFLKKKPKRMTARDIKTAVKEIESLLLNGGLTADRAGIGASAAETLFGILAESR